MLVAGGAVLVSGARMGVLASAEIYDPIANTWAPAGSMAQGRAEHTATLLGNGKVLVVSGTGAGFAIVTSAELYDPWMNTWSAAASPLSAHTYGTATLLPTAESCSPPGPGPAPRRAPRSTTRSRTPGRPPGR